MKTMKKIIGILLVVSMLTTLMPMSLFATDYSLTELDPDQMSAEEYAEWKASLAPESEDEFDLLNESGYIRNDFIEAYVNSEGHYTMGTTGGNPDSNTDNNKLLLYGHPDSDTTQTMINVDGNTLYFSASNTVFSDDGKQAISTANILGIEVKQILTIENNTYTGNPDVISIRYVMKNTSSTAKSIGARIMLDTMLGNNDGAPFRLPGIGNVTTDMEFYGDDIPEYWQAFDSFTDTNVISTGNFYRTVSERPDKVQFTYWRTIYDSPWNYSITPDRSFTSDSAVAAYFNPRTVLPGQSRTISTYYGISNFVGSDLDGDLAVRVTAPTSMGGEDGVYHNNPFEVTAYIANNTNGTVDNVTATIILPEELQMEGSDSHIVNLGSFVFGEDNYANWRIRAIPQAETKTVTFTIIVSGDGVETKQINYAIVLNATEDLHRYISFDLNGADGETPETQEVFRGEKGVEPTPAPTRRGYIFGGWYANPDCIGISWFDHHNTGELARADADVTLYAKWIEVEAFDFETDIFAFENVEEDFDDTSSSPRYKVKGDYKDILTKNQNNIAKINSIRNKKWVDSGAAFGMACVSALVKAGKLDAGFFQEGANVLVDFEYPRDNDTIFNLVTYYELIRYSETTANALDVGNDERENNINLVETLFDSEYPVVLGFDVYKNGRIVYGDTVVAYDIVATNDSYDISVYDPDDNSETFIYRVSKDYSAAEFVDTKYDNGTFSSLTKYALSVEDAINTYDYRNIQQELIALGRENGMEGLSLMSAEDSDVMRLTLNYDTFAIECTNGTSAEVVNGVKTEGDLDVCHAETLNTEGQELSVVFVVPNLPEDECYIIYPSADNTSVVTDEPLEVYVTNISDGSADGFYNEVVSDNNGSIEVRANGSLVVNNDTENYYYVLVSQNGNDVFTSLEFEGAGVAIEQNDDEIAIVGDDMFDTFVIISDGYSETYFEDVPASEGEVTIIRDGELFTLVVDGEEFEETELGYSVIYYSLGGTLIDAETDIPAGSTAERPDDPEREGFIFDGWYTSTSYAISELWDFENDTVDENVRLYAKWMVDEDYMHSVTFKAEGHDDIIILVRDGDSLEEVPAVPSNNGRHGQWDYNDFDNITSNIIVNAIYPDSVADIVFEASGVSAIAGDTVEIDITIDNNSGIGGYDIDVVFNNSLLTLISADCSDAVISSIVSPVATANANGFIGLVYVNLTNGNTYADGKLCTLTFEISEDAPEDEYVIDVVINDAFCYAGQTYGDIVIQEIDGVVEVTHDYSIELEYVPADCENDGYLNVQCTNCGDIKTEVYEALGHDEIYHNAKTPTCTEIGWYAYETCTRCDYTTYEERDALGHDFIIELENVSETCEDDGYITRKCSRCPETETEVIPALGHDTVYHDGLVPTCTESGYEAYETCNRCDYNTYTFLEELGHNLGTWVVTKPAKIGKEGEETRECSRCDYFETRTIDALPIPADTTIIMVQDVISYAGGTAKVDITIDENDGLAGLEFEMTFNNSVLTLTDINMGAWANFTVTPLAEANATGKIKFAFVDMSLSNVMGDGKIATLVFDIAEDVEPQVCPIVVTIPEETAFRYEGQNSIDVLVVAKDGEVDVQDYMIGDADRNFKINIRDAASILQYIAGWSVDINVAAADADGNGTVNIRDAARILQYIAGWNVTLGG